MNADDLLAEARGCAPGDDATELAVIVHRLADALEAALVAAQGAAPQAVKDAHEPSHDRVYCVRCGGNWPCQPAPVLPSGGVEEAELAEEIGRHKLVHVSVSRKSAFCACDPSVTAGVDDNRAWFEGHRARAVAEWLEGQGR